MVSEQFGVGLSAVAEIVLEVCFAVELERLQMTVYFRDPRKVRIMGGVDVGCGVVLH